MIVRQDFGSRPPPDEAFRVPAIGHRWHYDTDRLHPRHQRPLRRDASWRAEAPGKIACQANSGRPESRRNRASSGPPRSRIRRHGKLDIRTLATRKLGRGDARASENDQVQQLPVIRQRNKKSCWHNQNSLAEYAEFCSKRPTTGAPTGGYARDLNKKGNTSCLQRAHHKKFGLALGQASSSWEETGSR